MVIQGRAGGSDRRLVVRLGGVCSFLLVILEGDSHFTWIGPLEQAWGVLVVGARRGTVGGRGADSAVVVAVGSH